MNCGEEVPIPVPYWYDWRTYDDVTDHNGDICRGLTYSLMMDETVFERCKAGLSHFEGEQ